MTQIKTFYQLSGSVGLALKNILKERGIMHKDFGIMMGVHPHTVTKWVSGKFNFNLATLVRIEHKLGVKIIYVTKSEPNEKGICSSQGDD